MLYLVNPGGRPTRRRARSTRKARRRRHVTKGATVATRRRKRGAGGRFVKSSAPRRRRRSRSVAVAINRPRRRRRSRSRSRARRVAVAINRPRRHRRRFSRNPRFGLGGVVGHITEGGVIVLGQWGTARVAELVAGRVIPASFMQSSPLVSVAAANSAAALATSWVARMVMPKYARLLAAAAWAQAITSTAGSTPMGARLLSGNFSAPAPTAAGAASVAGYASARNRLAGYASGYNVTAGRQPGLAGYSGAGAPADVGRAMSVGSF